MESNKNEIEELLPLSLLIQKLPWGATKTWSMIRKGELPFLIRIGKSYFFYESSYVEYFKNMEGREI